MDGGLLIDLAWKSTVLALVVLAVLLLMRKHSPSHRAAVGGLGLLVLAILPIALVAAPALPIPSIDLPAPAAAVRAVPVTMEGGAAMFPLAIPDSAPRPAFALSAEQLAALLWLTGALIVLLRLAAGLITLRRWTRSAERVARSPPALPETAARPRTPI